jgi:hypothetical protein
MKDILAVIGLVSIIVFSIKFIIFSVQFIKEYKQNDTINKISLIQAKIMEVVMKISIPELIEDIPLGEDINWNYNNIILNYNDKMYMLKMNIDCSFGKKDLDNFFKYISLNSTALWIFDPISNDTVFRCLILGDESDIDKDIEFDKKFLKEFYKDLFKRNNQVNIRVDGVECRLSKNIKE